MLTRGMLCSLLILLSGCHGYRITQSHEPLGPVAQKTIGGGEIEVRDGEVFYRPERDDIEAILGVALEDSDDGLVVTQKLEPGSPLHVGDRILSVVPVYWMSQSLYFRILDGFILVPADGGTLVFEKEPPEPPHPVRAPRVERPRIEDLRLFASGAPWITLEAEVRRDGVTETIPLPLIRPEELLAIPRVDVTHQLRHHGIEVCEITDWPDIHKPLHAQRKFWERHAELDRPEHLAKRKLRDVMYMVTRVERDSLAALRGLRPMDLLLDVEVEVRPALPDDERLLQPFLSSIDFLNGSLRQLGWGWAVVLGSDGKWKQIHGEDSPAWSADTTPTNIHVPLIFSYESDNLGTHVGVGPADVLFHYSSERIYDPVSDAYDRGSHWSVLTTVVSNNLHGSAGTQSEFGARIFDSARLGYMSLRDLRQIGPLPQPPEQALYPIQPEVSVTRNPR